MRNRFILMLILFFPLFCQGQQQDFSAKKPGGLLSLGVRSTFNIFSSGSWDNFGYGLGGHFLIQLDEKVNTLWFADYIRTDIGGIANRTDYHIGWSVLYYPLPKYHSFNRLYQPFLQAGHCFDYTKVYENGKAENAIDRWSSAIQAGLGTHLNITKNFDITPSIQYMFHLGSDIHVHVEDGQVELEKHKGTNLEAHLLITLSLNYKIVNLW